MKRSIKGARAHIAACLLVGAGFAGSAFGAIVHSGPVNIPIPDNIDGIYMNIVTGAFNASAAAVPGWDINPYSALVGQFNLWGASAQTWFSPSGAIGGPYPLAPGTSIGGDVANFFRPGGGTDVGLQLTLNSSNNLIGFRFTHEGNSNQIHFGWLRLDVGATAGERSIVEYAYEDVAGTAIAAGDVGGPVGNLVIAPASIDFGDVLVGSTSAGSTVTLSNTGSASLDVTALTAAAEPFARNGGTCANTLPISIAVGDNCTLVFEFSPVAAGPSNQTLTVTANAPGSGTIGLSGTGVQGQLLISPNSLDFGDVRVGSASGPESVMFSNVGSASLDVTVLTMAAAPFARSGGDCDSGLPISIAAGDSCTLEFTFSPTVATASSQTLTVAANVPGSGTIELEGNGVQGNLVIAPASFDFGDEIVGDISELGTITLSNDGLVPVEVSSITLANLPFVRTSDGSCGNSLPFTIDDGDACTLTYTFAPSAAGSAQQAFAVGSDGSGDAGFELLGNGVPAEDEIFFDGFEAID